MSMNPKLIKSFKEHHEFMNSMSCLMFNFAYNWHLSHPDENITEILRKRTPLFLLYGINEFKDTVSEWDTLTARAEELVKKVNCDDFETAIFEYVKGFIEKCAERTYKSSIEPPADYNAGSLKYDAPLDELPKNHCNFHISNAIMPRSIFAERDYLPNCFFKLLDESEKKYGYDTLRTFSWLNDRPRWLELFPLEWYNNLSAPNTDIYGNYGFWGQLVTARGTLNEAAGNYVKFNCELKYKTRASHCSFSAMRKHLDNYLTAG